jgi:hypothetical protein
MAIEITNPFKLFNKFNVTGKDLKLYTSLIDKGQPDKAINLFIDKYMLNPSTVFSNQIGRYLNDSQEGELLQIDKNNVLKSVGALTNGITNLFKSNFQKFMDKYGESIFSSLNIRTKKVKQSILDATSSQYEDLISQRFNDINSNVSGNIRDIQRDFIIQNQKINRLKRLEEYKKNPGLIKKEMDRFHNELRKTHPDYYKMLDEKKFVTYANGSKHSIESYTEMATSTTLLNVDRTATEVVAKTKGQEVVEYYKRLVRRVKTNRKICPTILRNKVMGKSLLALNADTAQALGIMTIEQARATPDFAMGVNCRHSIRPVSRTFLRKVRGLIQEKE